MKEIVETVQLVPQEEEQNGTVEQWFYSWRCSAASLLPEFFWV